MADDDRSLRNILEPMLEQARWLQNEFLLIGEVGASVSLQHAIKDMEGVIESSGCLVYPAEFMDEYPLQVRWDNG